MKIAYYSDLHIDMAGTTKITLPVKQLVADDVDVIVLAGDLSNRAYDTANFIEDTLIQLKAEGVAGVTMPVIFVPGNHEFYKTPIDLSEEIFLDLSRKYANFHFLSSDKSPVMISDGDNPPVAFIGDILWTDFLLNRTQRSSMERAQYGMSDYSAIYVDFYGGDKWTPYHSRDHHRDAMMNLQDSISKIRDKSSITRIVVVSHHAPTEQSIHEQYKQSAWSDLNPAYASGILDEDSISYSKQFGSEVIAWIHGHVHNSVDVVADGVRVVSNPRGYTISHSYDRYSVEDENSEFSWNKYLII